jgi:uncharacterized small protein (DUF1192 family)
MVHGELTEKTPLLPEHFRRWLEIFTETVDSTFSGEKADFVKIRARAIADRMRHYVGEINDRIAIPRDNLAEVEALRRRSCHERS